MSKAKKKNRARKRAAYKKATRTPYQAYSYNEKVLKDGGVKFQRGEFNAPKTSMERLHYEATLRQVWSSIEDRTLYNTIRFLHDYFPQDDLIEEALDREAHRSKYDTLIDTLSTSIYDENPMRLYQDLLAALGEKNQQMIEAATEASTEDEYEGLSVWGFEELFRF